MKFNKQQPTLVERLPQAVATCNYEDKESKPSKDTMMAAIKIIARHPNLERDVFASGTKICSA